MSMEQEIKVTLGQWELDSEGQPFCIIKINQAGLLYRRMLKLHKTYYITDEDKVRTLALGVSTITQKEIMKALGVKHGDWNNGKTRWLNKIMESMGFDKWRTAKKGYRYISIATR